VISSKDNRQDRIPAVKAIALSTDLELGTYTSSINEPVTISSSDLWLINIAGARL